MTSSTLRRTNSFVKYGNPKSATILTLSHRLDTREVKERLVATGQIDSSVAIRNMWSELREMTDDTIQRHFKSDPYTSAVPKPKGRKQVVTPNHVRYLDDFGKVILQEHYRDDGSLLFLDYNEVKGQRRVQLFSSTGTKIAEWDRARALYNQWFEYVIAGKSSAVLIIDSGPIATIAHELRPRSYKLVHFVHVSHLQKPLEGRFGELTSNRVEAFRDQEQFDLVAVQTKQQIEDMAKIGLSRNNMSLLPSELSQSAIAPAYNPKRSSTSGIVVARLVELKQIDHAIQAIALAKPHEPDLTLDIAGTGVESSNLQALIDSFGLDEDVMLLGHVSDITSRLSRASYSLLTSRFEGFGLAIIESMAAGCIPIVYDIRYGAADIISHGVNGFIVPPGDIETLASQLLAFIRLPEEQKQVMREAAVQRAKDFLPEQSYLRWQTALDEVVKVPAPKPFKNDRYIRVREAIIMPNPKSIELGLIFDDSEVVRDSQLQIILKARGHNRFFQSVSADHYWKRTDDRSVYSFSLPHEWFSQSVGITFDVFIRKIGGPWDSRVRIKVPKSYRSIVVNDMRWYRTEFGNWSLTILPPS